MTDMRHGTWSAYKRGCRCGDCKEVQHAYYLRNREEIKARSRDWVARNRARNAETQRAYRERLKRGEVVLPELDWAICERGGSQAQAQAHRRRDEKPCANCLAAETRAHQERRRARAAANGQRVAA